MDPDGSITALPRSFQEGLSGYKTQTYRVVYINGKEVSREEETKSSYKKLDKIILTGTKGKPADIPAVGEPTQIPPDNTLPGDTVTPPEDGNTGDAIPPADNPVQTTPPADLPTDNGTPEGIAP